MIKLSDLTGKRDYLLLPHIPRNEVRILWHEAYWDGVKSGFLLYDGQKYWFEVCDEADESASDREYYRRFLVIRLSPKQLTEEEGWHELFQQKVGTNTDYDEN